MLADFLIIQRLLLLKKKLDFHSSMPKKAFDVKIKFLNPADCKKIATENQWQANFNVAIDEIFKDSDLCAVAEINKKLVHWTHIAFKSAYVAEIEKRISINSESAYLKSIYTIPDCRKMGIASIAMESVLTYLQARGIKDAYILVNPQNHSMLGVSESAGFKAIGVVKLVKIGKLKLYHHKGSVKKFLKPI